MQIKGCIRVWICAYPNSLQEFARTAVIEGHSAVFTTTDDVLVIGGEAHYSITM